MTPFFFVEISGSFVRLFRPFKNVCTRYIDCIGLEQAHELRVSTNTNKSKFGDFKARNGFYIKKK
ncbi:hypothetical protein HMPREF9944_01235 [Segatella maculosa OT 289]|uniref:Uncharacterized protein n=1 Tax=Segatella maculosa OT 289 TaxID=999422 RepID=H1HM41_9BACT|nr:hypothetical protein HMPREF9944_01235 [Segatella maculosa OT 289]